MAKQAVATRTDLDPIDRLEEKVKLLVSVVAQMRGEHAKAVDDNSRLRRSSTACARVSPRPKSAAPNSPRFVTSATWFVARGRDARAARVDRR